MPKRWRREERRRLASEEASRIANLARQTGIDDGHQSWRNLVVCSANKEDTTIATSTESVTIAAGQALDLPVHINTKTAVVHYAFKVAEMDVTVSAMILPSETKTKDPNTAITTTTTHSHLIVLDTILLPSSKGWLRGQFTPILPLLLVPSLILILIPMVKVLRLLPPTPTPRKKIPLQHSTTTVIVKKMNLIAVLVLLVIPL